MNPAISVETLQQTRSRYLRSKPRSRLIQLDLLRGLAVLLVVGRHMPIEPSQSGWARPFAYACFQIGWTGVDLFFVLSGFLVGGLLFEELRVWSDLKIGRFLVRRGLKIWPAYLVFIIYLTLWLWLSGKQPSLIQAIASLLPNYLHVQNYIPTLPLHTWSLAVEEHFYLALPIILWLAVHRVLNWRRAILSSIVAAVILAIAFAGVRLALMSVATSNSVPEALHGYVAPYLNSKFLWFFGAQLLGLFILCIFALCYQGRDYRSIPAIPIIAVGLIVVCTAMRSLSYIFGENFGLGWTFPVLASHLRIDSIFFGLLLAYLKHFKPVAFGALLPHRGKLIVGGLALVILTVSLPSWNISLYMLEFSLIYLGYAALLVGMIFTRAGEGIIGRCLTLWPARWLAYLGAYSYSIYLWHINPARLSIEELINRQLIPITDGGLRWIIVMSLYVPVAVVVGIVLGKLVEMPALILRDRLFPSRASALAEAV